VTFIFLNFYSVRRRNSGTIDL